MIRVSISDKIHASPAALARAFLLVWIWFLTQPPAAQAAETRSYILTTATTGGTYYPVGVALGTLAKMRLQPTHGISLSAINSAGSRENIKLMRENQAQFALLQAIFGVWAVDGSGQLKSDGPQRYLRSITMLWDNVEHVLIKNKFVNTGTIADLTQMTGAQFSIGKRNSGTESSNRVIFQQIGLDPDRLFDLSYLGYGPSADALQNNTIDGLSIPGGVPVAAITRAFAAPHANITLLSFTDAQLTAMNEAVNVWSRFVIKANTYPGQTEPVNTASMKNFLAVRDDVDEDAVYWITRTVYENLAFLANIHRATRAMTLESAVEGLPVPLHPGALRYYREQGLDIPKALIPE